MASGASAKMSSPHHAVESDAVRVVAARFDPVIAIGLDAVLAGDRRLRLVETGLDADALLQAVATRRPHVVIVDEATERATRERCIQATGVLVFAHKPTPRYGMMLMAAGATCVARSCPPEEILAAVHLVALGVRVFTSADGQRIERRYPDVAPALTRRELEVLERLTKGRSHKQIAHELQIGVRTVHTYASNVCRKLGARTKRELIGMPMPSGCHE
jgi:DNA-binding NarL/FixJ family response regulator